MLRRRTVDEGITGWSALATAALFFPAIVVGIAYPPPTPDGPAGDLGAYVVAHRTTLLVVLYLTALAWGGVLIVFAAGLRAVLGRAEGGSGVWSSVAFGACVATAVAILATLVPADLAVFRGTTLDGRTQFLLSDAAAVANLLTAFPNAIYTIAAAVVIIRTAVLPRWIAYGALLVAAIHLLSATSLAPTGPFAPSGVLPNVAPVSHAIWLVCIGIELLRGSEWSGLDDAP